MPQQVTVTFTINLEQVITWIIIGIVAGALAGILIRGRRFSLLTSLITGLVGAVVGGLIFFGLLHVQPSEALQKGLTLRWIDMIMAFVGAVIVLLIVGFFYGFRRR
jgi:uncharacterized membrane protein YeaQ/YmgE (transglycosylase-associated protein family)